MDKKELFDRAERALNQAFDTAKKSARLVVEKAGMAAQVTKLLVEKSNLEHRVTKQFVRIGSSVYEKAVRQGPGPFPDDSELRDLVEETKGLEEKLAHIEAELERWAREKSLARKRPRS